MTITNFKQNDRLPDYTATLMQGLGTLDESPIDLTAASGVKFLMRRTTTGTVKVNAAATIVVAAAGTVSYAWAAADLDTVGDYYVEWEITYGTRTLTVPASGYDTVRVVDDIG